MEEESLRAFAEAAEKFCEFVANPSLDKPTVFLEAAQQHLLNLYQKALHLKQVDLQVDIEFAQQIPKIHFKEITELLSIKLDTNRYYLSVSSPTNLVDNEAGCADLLDDLGDIYEELKNSLSIYHLDLPSRRENAAWQIRFGFRTHWGNHCIDALRGIHFFLQQASDNPE